MEPKTIVLEGVDRYRVTDPLFECVRVALSYRGEAYSPAYIQGISGAAFRIAGICPCAPTCSYAMETWDLVKLLGYEMEPLSLWGEGIDPQTRVHEMVARVKDEIRAGRPVIVWHAFTMYEWDVVCGYDEEKKQFLGRGSYAGLDGYATADQTRMATCMGTSPSFGAILVGEKRGQFDSRTAELAALREAVHHAHSRANEDKLGGDEWVMLEGLLCYDRWVSDFSKPATTRGPGDAYCLGVYRSTHRAASGFMRELAPKYPEVAEHLECAAAHFATEADMLDQCVELLGWESPKGPDPERNARATTLLSQARDCYARGIEETEKALANL